MKQEITRLLGTDISYSLDSKNYSKASLLATTEIQVKSLNRCFAKANASELVDIILECDE
ncbi:hypothetical protein [Aliikangiella sp. IMCC44359]|uniref:hypothetical protein n=1 Tax=Aliikangiella sp. IMCC44359 TaxID=3459125 RepID=UPI00403AE409